MIGDVIFILAHLVTEFLNYIFAYVVIFGAKVSRKVSNWIWGIGTAIGIHMLLLLLAGKEGARALSFLTMILVPIFLLRPAQKRNFWIYPFVAMETSVLSICLSFFVAIILDIPESEILNSPFLTIICQSIPIIVMLGIYRYQKRRHLSEFRVELNWQQYTIFYIVALSLFFLLGSFQGISEMDIKEKCMNYVGCASSIACIVLIIVTIWQGIVINRAIRLKERNTMNEKYMACQKEYYDQLLNQDEKMRRFRHDMNAHIQMLKAYCAKGEMDKLKGYLEMIMKESAIYSLQKYTGNRAVDAIFQSLVSEAENKEILVEFNGDLPKQTKVEDYDFCTIIYNLMKNAIEAGERVEDASRRMIQIEIGAYDSQVYITVRNPAEKEKVSLCTTKVDKENHGLGLGNVKRAVEKYNGCFQVKFENGWFSAEVSI